MSSIFYFCGDSVIENPCIDGDRDGFLNITCGGDDCDDTNPSINPDADEDCSDNVDNNCNDLVDIQEQSCKKCDEDETRDCGDCGTQTCNNGEWGDCLDEGICSPNDTDPCGVNGIKTCNSSCQWGSCIEECVDNDQDGFGSGNGCTSSLDCDDTSPLCTNNCYSDMDSDNIFDCKDDFIQIMTDAACYSKPIDSCTGSSCTTIDSDYICNAHYDVCPTNGAPCIMVQTSLYYNDGDNTNESGYCGYLFAYEQVRVPETAGNVELQFHYSTHNTCEAYTWGSERGVAISLTTNPTQLSPDQDIVIIRIYNNDMIDNASISYDVSDFQGQNIIVYTYINGWDKQYCNLWDHFTFINTGNFGFSTY